MSRMDEQFRFIKEIDKEKGVIRQNYITAADRRETDSDHAWHMAMMTVLLAEYADSPIDVLKTVTMVLIHDLVEIDAGDTFAYDEKAQTGKHDREARAADRIFGLLPPDQAEKLRGLWEEFEEGCTAEAKFARAMDRIQPLLLNDATDGRAWREHGVRLEQVMARNARTHEASEALWDYALTHFIQPNADKGNLQ